MLLIARLIAVILAITAAACSADPPPGPPKGQSVAMIFFDLNSSTVISEGHKVLAPVAKALISQSKRVELRGHADEREPAISLAKARAEAVKAVLVEKGVSASRIVSIGEGATRPMAPGEKGSLNRRVEVFVEQ